MRILWLPLLFAAAAGVVCSVGSIFVLTFYRGRYGKQEKRASAIWAATISMFFLSMFYLQHFIVGRAGDLISGSVMLGIATAGIVCIVKTLRASD